MNKKSDLIEIWKVRIFKRSTTDQSWDVFLSRRWLFALTWSSVIGSWTWLLAIWAGILVPPLQKNGNPVSAAGIIADVPAYAFTICLVAYVVLRKTLKHIATAPRAALDERELAMRDEAFNLGYLVVRRVGLGVISVGLFLSLAAQVSHKYHWQPLSWMSNLPANDLSVLVATLFAAMVYSAYSFPLIIIAWKKLAEKTTAIEPPEFEDSKSWANAVNRLIKPYRRLMTLALICALWGLFIANALGADSGSSTANWIDVSKDIAVPASLVTLFFTNMIWAPVALFRLRWLFESKKASKYASAQDALKLAGWLMLFAATAIPVMQKLWQISVTVEGLDNFTLAQVFSTVMAWSLWILMLAPAIAFVGATVAKVKASRSTKPSSDE